MKREIFLFETPIIKVVRELPDISKREDIEKELTKV
jgi:hypothetical protein